MTDRFVECNRPSCFAKIVVRKWNCVKCHTTTFTYFFASSILCPGINKVESMILCTAE